MANPQHGFQGKPGNDIGRGAAQKAGEAGRDAAEAGRRAIDETTRAAETVTDEAARTGHEAARAGADAAREAADAGRRTAEEAARAAEVVTQEAARTGERAARAGAEIARSGAETVQRTVRSSLDMAKEAAERSADEFGRIFGLSGHAEQVARDSSKDLGALIECNAVLARGAQEISNEWLNAVQRRFQRHLDAFGEFLRCRTPQDVLALQSRLAREGLENLLDSTRKVSEISIDVAEQATRKIRAVADRHDNDGRRAA